VTAATSLTGDGIAELRVGRPIPVLRSLCRIVRDTTLAEGNEGMPERRVSVLVATDTVQATVVDGEVWRFEITQPSLRTPDSLGVGTTADVLKARGATLNVGEGVFAVLPSHCGLSFRLDDIAPAAGTG
jgi:hypothetical protein